MEYTEYTGPSRLGGESYESDVDLSTLWNNGRFPETPLTPSMRQRLEKARRSAEIFGKMFNASTPKSSAIFDPPLTVEDLWLCGCDTYNYRESAKCSHCGECQR